MKSDRNKTIDISVNEGRTYLERCISVEKLARIEDVLDKTILGDTFSVLPLLPRGFADLVIVDPPYNLTKDFHGSTFRETTAKKYLQYTEAWLDLLLPLIKDTGILYVCCDWKSSMVIAQALAERLHVQNRITWQREKGRSATRNWKNSMEDIWFATKSRDYIFHADAVRIRRRVVAPYRVAGKPKDWEETANGNFRNTGASNFWDDISVPYWSMPENTAHPTQKPEKLLAKLILASSSEGDVVFDPFLGSGSTSVTAKKLGRHYLGIEHNPQYCVWAEKRLCDAETHPSIQGYEDGVFWERNAHMYPPSRRKQPR
ncbi:MAG: site-specific DNA-methyltransferase [Ruminococcus sp.]|nr:site-specific DNA-methyltransferase [Ruminococcus sp.]